MSLALAVAVSWGVLVGGLGAWFTTALTDWYRALKKPSWQPPDWAFGPAWTLILALASWSAWLAWTQAPDTESRLLVVALFVLNGLANLAWSPLFFRLHRPDWALIEVVFLWLSVLVPIILLAPISAAASWLMVPYLLWVSFAAYLNWTIVQLNGPFGD